MDIMTLASFVAFFAMVVAWMAAPTHAKQRLPVIEPGVVGAD